MVYEPGVRLWIASPEEVTNWGWVGTSHVNGAYNEAHLILFKPPVDQRKYLTGIAQDRENLRFCPETNFCNTLYPEYSKAYTSIMGSYMKGVPFDQMKQEVTTGLPTSQMKQWLLYSGATSEVF
jgi:hypothetical protein